MILLYMHVMCTCAMNWYICVHVHCVYTFVYMCAKSVHVVYIYMCVHVAEPVHVYVVCV